MVVDRSGIRLWRLGGTRASRFSSKGGKNWQVSSMSCSYAANNVAKRPLEFFIRLAREQLRPTYGQGFRGAPLQTDIEEHGPQTIRPGGARAKVTQPTSEVSRSEEEV
jgi:hypothetical protein